MLRNVIERALWGAQAASLPFAVAGREHNEWFYADRGAL
jgi:hypothetical protein